MQTQPLERDEKQHTHERRDDQPRIAAKDEILNVFKVEFAVACKKNKQRDSDQHRQEKDIDQLFFSIFRQAFSHNFLLSPDNLFYIYLQSAFYIPSSRAHEQKRQIKTETDESVKWRNFPRRGAKAKKKADFYSVFFPCGEADCDKKAAKRPFSRLRRSIRSFRKGRTKIRSLGPEYL